MKSPILFIGYEPPLRDEISDFLKDRQGEAFFADNVEETIRFMNGVKIGTVVLNLQRLEDIAILRYINVHYQQTHVLLMPGLKLKEAIPVLTTGHFEIINEPFNLQDLKSHL